MDVLPEKEFAEKQEQLKVLYTDKDRLRLLKQLAANYKVTSEQVKTLVQIQHYGDPKIQTAILLYPVVVDPQNFLPVLDLYQPPDKADIKKQLKL